MAENRNNADADGGLASSDNLAPETGQANETFRVPVQRVRQPVGDMYIASVKSTLITRIAHFDVRRIQRETREIETYLGIQRPLDDRRVEELAQYVNFRDASFPGSIIVAIDSDYADYDPDAEEVIVRNYRLGEQNPSREMRDIARVLDGQHRIAGLEKFRGEEFDVILTIFIGADISDQAYIFATVNLEQRKVNRSLAYDLFALARSRSPQRTCHNIAVTFDRDVDGPFHKRIKRLGTATPGRDFETLTQATFVEGLLGHISTTPKADRDALLRKRNLPLPGPSERQRLVMRKFFVEEQDLAIAETYDAFFKAVAARWPDAWRERGAGFMLNRTNGYRALTRFFRYSYNLYADGARVVTFQEFSKVFERASIEDYEFNVDNFPPGSSGESLLLSRLLDETQVLNLTNR
jgi:DGQHR domain-containing protein